MRTTITLDQDTRMLIERAMRDRNISFKDAVNQAIRTALAPPQPRAHQYTEPRPLGPPKVDVTKALMRASELEDDALARALAEGR